MFLGCFWVVFGLFLVTILANITKIWGVPVYPAKGIFGLLSFYLLFFRFSSFFFGNKKGGRFAAPLSLSVIINAAAIRFLCFVVSSLYETYAKLLV